MMRMMQQVNFMKNISLTGAALLISYFGAGPLSIDSRFGTLRPSTRTADA